MRIENLADWRRVAACGVAVLLLHASGCRGGARSLSVPAWPSFRGSKTADASAIKSAPSLASADGPIKKPAASASPYPTTSTPAGYVVNDPTHSSAAGTDTIQAAAADPQMVTYGVTPPLRSAAPPETQQIVTTQLPSAAPVPQVGPYATLPPPPPAAEQPTAPGLPATTPSEVAMPEHASLAAAPVSGPPGGGYPVAPPAQPSAFPATAGYEPTPRVADARAAAVLAPATAAAVQSPPLAAVPESAAGGVSARYASQASRFGDDAAPVGPGAASSFPAETGFVPGAAAAATLPGDFGPPGGLPSAPAGVPASLPTSNPSGLTAPPLRRPKTDFRPGGTTSYRPAEQIFVDDPPQVPSSVRTASYEVLAPNGPLPPRTE
ncbi:MAG: hypothetical protein DWH79_08280 [Planctomycetota bacterium]|nr:MAG: hypothetical protein DWH79_08280 [Planctomycetota bacterium]